MSERSRAAITLFLPVLGAVFLLVRAAWLAYVHTLEESELHVRVFEHATAVAAVLWSVIITLAAGASWGLSGRLVRRRSGGPR